MCALRGNSLLYLPVHVTGMAMLALVDTRASQSFVSAKFTAMTKLQVKRDVPMVVQLPTSRIETMDRVLHYELLVGNVIYAQTFYVLDMSLPMIVGLDFC